MGFSAGAWLRGQQSFIWGPGVGDQPLGLEEVLVEIQQVAEALYGGTCQVEELLVVSEPLEEDVSDHAGSTQGALRT